jgi:diaminopimelate epimerase
MSNFFFKNQCFSSENWLKILYQNRKRSIKPPMKREFLKMHGLGNDFVVFDARRTPLAVGVDAIRRLSDRRTGVGFDQMVIIDPPRTAGTDAFMRLYNADGSEIGACGNATRCVAKFLSDDLQKQDVKIETVSTVIGCIVTGDDALVDMGAAYLDWKDIPLNHEEDTNSLVLDIDGFKNPAAVNVGNPHAVFFVDDVMAVPLETVGPKVECHPLFPKKVNVEFAEIISPDTIRMRVWERGVGVTMACGTGACATAVAAARRGLAGRKVKVILDGGTLDIEWRESDNHVLMRGAAALSFRGEVEV